MKYQTPEFIHRKGVVLSRELVPYDSALTFNAGVSRGRNGYVMLFRNDYGFCKKDFDDFYAGISDNTTPKTNLGAAISPDGVNWKVQPRPVFSLSLAFSCNKTTSLTFEFCKEVIVLSVRLLCIMVLLLLFLHLREEENVLDGNLVGHEHR